MNWMLHYNAFNTIAWLAYPKMERAEAIYIMARGLKSNEFSLALYAEAWFQRYTVKK